jgi:hypothetical protein
MPSNKAVYIRRAAPAGRTALVRSRSRYELIVSYPWGTSAISGYRRAARHFGLHTRLDSTSKGTDQWCLLIHRDEAVLRAAARSLTNYARSCNDREIDNEGVLDEEFEILLNSGAHWFAHDWKWWDIEGDEGALEGLRWSRIVTQRDDGSYRVSLRRRRTKSE